MKIIISDIDECVLNWRGTFSTWIKENTIYDPIGLIDAHENIENWIQCDNKEMLRLIIEFNRSNYFADLKPYDHALEWIPKLYKEGFKFIAITACATDLWTQKTRMENLYRYFPEMFIAQHCVGLGESKLEYLKLYKPAFWVEDKMSHALDGLAAGHECYLMDYPCNKAPYNRHIHRVHGWQGIYDNLMYAD